MKSIIKFFYITLAFFITLLSLILIWSAAYSNYYVNQLNYAIETDDYEFLLKNYDYYIKEPIYSNKNDDYNIHIYTVILHNKNEEGLVERNTAFSFYITSINEKLIHLATTDKDDNAKMEVVCEGFKKDYPIFSHEYFSLNLLNFELNLDEIKEICPNEVTITLFDQESKPFFTFDTNINTYNLKIIENNGIKGYNASESFKKLFPSNIVVTLIAVVFLYIIIFIFVWSYFKYLVKKRKEKRK